MHQPPPLSPHTHPGTSLGLRVESGSGGRREDGVVKAALQLTDHLPRHEDAAHGTGGTQLPLRLQPLGGEARLWQGVPVAMVEGHLHRFGPLREGLLGLCKETEASSVVWLGPGPQADLLLTAQIPDPADRLHQRWPIFLSFPRPGQSWDLVDRGPHERWGLNEHHISAFLSFS